MERKYEVFLGTGVLILGIAVLLFVVSFILPIVQAPGDFFDEQSPDDVEQTQPPECSFEWNSNDLNVEFTDTSMSSSEPIESYSWEFGDGETANLRSPSHTYDNPQEYEVRLTVRDETGRSSTATATVYVDMMVQNDGHSEESFSSDDIGFVLDFTPIAITIIMSTSFIVMFLVGGSILKAGWNLIAPRGETITVKVRPKHLQVEQVEYSAPPAQHYGGQAPPQSYQQPAQQNYRQRPPGQG
jgi:PKD repeat protein